MNPAPDELARRLSSLSIPAESTASSLLEAQSRRGRVIKRGGDVLFSLLVLSLGSPLFLLLALLVKLSSRGSVFYCQRRISRGYKGFGCLKFRTMRRDADRVLAAMLEADPTLRAEFERDHKLKRDPRITPLGKFLRRSSLDELPQFINVLRGEMSGRNNLTYRTRVRLDLTYVRQRSFWLDLGIVLRTIGVVLLPMDRGAY
jgi:lipopolysaccharide/colanic/teichoic acid biosynthesis glycosyltransferase